MATGSWDWPRLCNAVCKEPSQTREQLQRAGLSVRSLAALSQPAGPGEPYGRKVLFRSPQFEVMLASWVPDSNCAPHDHGDSNGVVWLVQGQFIEYSYRWLDGSLLPCASQALTGGAATVLVEPGDIHSMSAAMGGLSLHIYNPPIDRMKVFDLNGRRTLTVSNDCGAWIPRHHRQLLDVKPWPKQPSLSI